MLLENKVAIITGGSSGIGRAAALLFARHGAKLVLNARRAEQLDDVASEVRQLGGEAIAIAGDVALLQTHHRIIAACAQFGGPDIAFNNAGSVGVIAPLADQQPDDWDQVLTVETIPSLAPRIAARSQPILSTAWFSRCMASPQYCSCNPGRAQRVLTSRPLPDSVR